MAEQGKCAGWAFRVTRAPGWAPSIPGPRIPSLPLKFGASMPIPHAVPIPLQQHGSGPVMKMSRRHALQLGVLSSAALVLPFGRTAASGMTVGPQRVFTGTKSIPEGFTVPAGEVWTFDPNVSTTVVVRANVVVEGTLVMRPARPDVVHTLRFEGVDESKFVGGHSDGAWASDVGLWVLGDGIVDAQGTPKAGWNRTGDDSTWTAADELIVAPNVKNDFLGFKPFTKGAAVPTQLGPDGVVYRTEVANLTRNVRIEGTASGRAHIMFHHCRKPQTLRYVAIRYMGPQKPTGDTYLSGGVRKPVYEGVLGRYGLHFHKCGDVTRGSLIEGVVVRNTGGAAFVPHGSNGITFRDCVAHDVRDSGFWWDPGDATHDTTWERCAVFGIPKNPGTIGLGISGFFHGIGLRNVTRGCVAVGLLNQSVNSGGFNWPSAANHSDNVWFWDDNVAHNNKEGGIGVWQNDKNPHLISRYVGYHNGVGISHGAYTNTYTYRDCVTFGNGTELIQHAIGATAFETTTFDGNVLITKHSLASLATTRYSNCRITGLVTVSESVNPGVIRFESSTPVNDMRPDRFIRNTVLSDIRVVNSDGLTFKL